MQISNARRSTLTRPIPLHDARPERWHELAALCEKEPDRLNFYLRYLDPTFVLSAIQ
jgi:hypothetical protein